VVADLEEVTIKIWLAGDTPDTIAFELSGIGDPANLAALIEASRPIPTDPDSPLRDNPASPSLTTDLCPLSEGRRQAVSSPIAGDPTFFSSRTRRAQAIAKFH
jgi:hypothetical protein